MSFPVRMRQAISFCSLLFSLCVSNSAIVDHTQKKKIYPVAVLFGYFLSKAQQRPHAVSLFVSDKKPHSDKTGMNKQLKNVLSENHCIQYYVQPAVYSIQTHSKMKLPWNTKGEFLGKHPTLFHVMKVNQEQGCRDFQSHMIAFCKEQIEIESLNSENLDISS